MEKISSEEVKRFYKEAFRAAPALVGGLIGGGVGALTGEDLGSTLVGAGLGAGGGMAGDVLWRNLLNLRPPRSGSIGNLTEATRGLVNTIGSAKGNIAPTREVIDRLNLFLNSVRTHGIKGLKNRSPSEITFDKELPGKAWGAFKGLADTLAGDKGWDTFVKAYRGFDPKQFRAGDMKWKEIQSLWKLLRETEGLFR